MTDRAVPGRGYALRRLSAFRKLSIESFDALPQGHCMTALLEIDVTAARSRLRGLRRAGAPCSLFAYLVKRIAVELAREPGLNAMRAGGKMAVFDGVDVNLPLEVPAEGESHPRQVVVRDAHLKPAAAIDAEISAARGRWKETGATGEEDRKVEAWMRLLALVPRFLRGAVLRAVASDPGLVRAYSGTVFVTSVAGFGGAGGFALPYVAGPRASAFAIGNVVRKPVVVGGAVVPRDVLSLTASFNHDLVDGAPAARFCERLRRAIESAEGLPAAGGSGSGGETPAGDAAPADA